MADKPRCQSCLAAIPMDSAKTRYPVMFSDEALVGAIGALSRNFGSYSGATEALSALMIEAVRRKLVIVDNRCHVVTSGPA